MYLRASNRRVGYLRHPLSDLFRAVLDVSSSGRSGRIPGRPCPPFFLAKVRSSNFATRAVPSSTAERGRQVLDCCFKKYLYSYSTPSCTSRIATQASWLKLEPPALSHRLRATPTPRTWWTEAAKMRMSTYLYQTSSVRTSQVLPCWSFRLPTPLIIRLLANRPCLRLPLRDALTSPNVFAPIQYILPARRVRRICRPSLQPGDAIWRGPRHGHR